MAEDLKSQATDFVKKVLAVGVGTIFLTEESLRALAKDAKIPKEVLGGILDSASKTKSEFFEKFSNEVMNKVVDKMDPKDLINEVIRSNDISLEVKVNFSQKKD